MAKGDYTVMVLGRAVTLIVPGPSAKHAELMKSFWDTIKDSHPEPVNNN